MLSLYIHIPWCVKKCPYCDFNSHALKDEMPEQQYVDALIQDLGNDLHHVQGRELGSIFFGGGTPSLFSGEAIHRILSNVQSRIAFAADIEITLEANPGTVEKNKFLEFKDAGINRLSIGVQSFDDEKLKSLGRIHSAKEAVTAAASEVFDNFNLDLMFGLPNQTIDDALIDLKQAIQLNPTHISWYQLTIEPNTLFAKHTPTLPVDDYIWEMQEKGIKLLSENHYSQYEVSAYSKEGKECRHNLNYWNFGDYLGIGAGAHGKLTTLRYAKYKNPRDYLNSDKPFIEIENVIPTKDIPFEFMLNALRLMTPITKEMYESQTGLKFKDLYPILSAAKAKDLIEFDDKLLRATVLGRRFLNDLVGLFME